MMALSQNGWGALESAPPAVQIPGTDVKLRIRPGDVATVLAYLAARYHAEVEPLDLPGERDEWGWAYRPVRGSTSRLSNHASGTAIDLNATRHPRGVKGTFTKTQKAAVRRILADLDGVVRWGEDYTTTIDGMHFEINADPKEVARVADRLRDKEDDDMKLDEVIDLGKGQSAVLGEADRQITLEEAYAHLVAQAVAQTRLLVEIVAELRKRPA